ncbi:MAG: DUF2335 domain-containing protein [Gemmatimonadaceae bacterium]|nr:DUF2335 domain-containing protein [Gemmatimonadaceae bacterium]
MNIKGHSGPIPSPDTLQEYEDRFPGLAKEIVTWTSAEQNNRLQQAAHEREMERITTDATIEDQRAGRSETKRGQWMLYSVLLVSLATAIYMAISGQEKMAALFMSPIIVQVLRLLFPPRSGAPTKL